MKAITDKFTKNRGGRSKFYKITCGKCGRFVFYYQKDGAGILKRAYLDRITPYTKYNKGKFLVCKCKDLLGAFCIYPREKRQAIEFFVGAVKRTPVKSETIPA